MIDCENRLVFSGKHDHSVKQQISKRILRVAERMICLGGGPASYTECAPATLPPGAVTRYFPPGFVPEEAATSYLSLCELLDSDVPFCPDRIQTRVLKNILSEYVQGMDGGGIGTLTRFHNHKEIYAAVRTGLKNLAAGRWDPPFIYLFAYDYAECERPAIQFVMRYLEDIRCVDYLLLGGKMPDIPLPDSFSLIRGA